MMILLTAALAAATSVVQSTPVQDPEAQHMAQMGKPEQADCCPCKDMTEKHESHARQQGHTGR